MAPPYTCLPWYLSPQAKSKVKPNVQNASKASKNLRKIKRPKTSQNLEFSKTSETLEFSSEGHLTSFLKGAGGGGAAGPGARRGPGPRRGRGCAYGRGCGRGSGRSGGRFRGGRRQVYENTVNGINMIRWVSEQARA